MTHPDAAVRGIDAAAAAPAMRTAHGTPTQPVLVYMTHPDLVDRTHLDAAAREIDAAAAAPAATSAAPLARAAAPGGAPPDAIVRGEAAATRRRSPWHRLARICDARRPARSSRCARLRPLWARHRRRSRRARLRSDAHRDAHRHRPASCPSTWRSPTTAPRGQRTHDARALLLMMWHTPAVHTVGRPLNTITTTDSPPRT